MSNITEKHTVESNAPTNKKAGNKFTFGLIAVVIAGTASMPASAAKYRNNSSYNNSYQNSSYDSAGHSSFEYATVVNVNPVVETYRVNNPVEQCWDEQVPVRSRYTETHARSKTKTPEIVGAIIGGILGNQVGKRGGGKARDVATVAGAVLGGSIGRDTKHRTNNYNDRYEATAYQTVQRCELKDSYVSREQVVAYDVEYKYRGNIFHTQTTEHPGKKIKVKVTVNPYR